MGFTIDNFKDLMKQGNKVITGGMIDLSDGMNQFATIEFDDMSCDKDSVNFSYVDRGHDMAAWQGERAPFYKLTLNQIESVKQMHVDDNLFGDYCINVKLSSLTVNMQFDVKKRTDISTYGLLSNEELANSTGDNLEKDTVADNQKEIIDNMLCDILYHKGSFLINVNSGDFVSGADSFGFEAFNLVFTSIKQLQNKNLLSFDNSQSKPLYYTDEKVPVYSMSFSSSFYVEVKDIASIEELITEDYQDVFELPSVQIFNIYMKNGSIITIGLYE